MANTLILYDGKLSTAQRVAETVSYLIGTSMTVELSEAPEDLSSYRNVCIVFSYYGSLAMGKTTAYLTSGKEKLKDKQIAFIAIGISDMGFARYILDMQEAVGCREIVSQFLNGEAHAIEAGHEIAKVLHNPGKPLDDETLMDAIRAFISSHNTLALATASGGNVRCTPLEYIFRNDVFYIFSEGGSKFRGLLENDKVSAAIFDSYKNNAKLKGLQVTGRSRLVPFMSDEYQETAKSGGHGQVKFEELPFRMNLICVTPYVYEFLNADFKKQGFDEKQFYVTAFKKQSLMQ